MNAITTTNAIKASELDEWTLQLTRGLQHMESLNVFHRDIKPDK
jgi:serine/threonine protein kinase